MGAQCVEMFVQFLGVRVMFGGVEWPSLQFLVFALKRLTRLHSLACSAAIASGSVATFKARPSIAPAQDDAAHAPPALLVLIVGVLGWCFGWEIRRRTGVPGLPRYLLYVGPRRRDERHRLDLRANGLRLAADVVEPLGQIVDALDIGRIHGQTSMQIRYSDRPGAFHSSRWAVALPKKSGNEQSTAEPLIGSAVAASYKLLL